MIIKLATEPQEIIDHLRIREIVFIDGQNVPYDLEHDGLDSVSTLIIVYDNEKPIGAGRYRFVDDYIKIERIAVLEEYRGKGIGKDIMDFLENQVIENTSIRKLVLNSQCSAQIFYEKLGYEPIGDIFMEADIQHVKMIKYL